MPDTFDAYREALIVEESTVWTEEYEGLAVEEKRRVEQALHADPENCKHLNYVRMHTGFCREITVTADDYDRASA